MRLCGGCGNVELKNRRAKYCSSACRTAALSRIPIPFVGVDGEGVTRENGEHDYVLLSVGDESLTCARGQSRLRWWEIFEFLADHADAYPDACYIGFFLSYDFTHWIRTMSESDARSLLTDEGISARRIKRAINPRPVELVDPHGQAWECDILAMKRFKLRRKGARWIWINDTGGFWQRAFMRVIDPKRWPDGSPVSEEDYALILEGKNRRATAQFDRAMIRYNLAENRALASVTSELDRAFRRSGTVLRRTQWFGPGQVANQWLKRQSAMADREAVRRACGDDILNDITGCAYGGWFEIMAHGHIGRAYEYDLNSAYPWIIAGLPCLLHGRWTRGIGEPPDGDYVAVRGVWYGTSTRSGVAPHRAVNGRILRPGASAGWLWATELYAACAAGFCDGYSIVEWIKYDPCDCPPPLAGIRELYLQRLDVGKNSPEGIALKLTYNSVYGKLAQTVGMPRWSNVVYSSLITSGCRTSILNAIATHPKRASDLLMVATDGVYFRTPHGSLNMSSETLGAWDSREIERLTLFQPGIYWDDSVRAGATSVHSRGVSKTHLTPILSELDDAFASFNGREWPSIEIPIPFSMVTARLALARGKWNTCGRIHGVSHSALCAPDCKGGRRVLNSDPIGKRNPHARLEEGVWRTKPHPFPRYWDPEHPMCASAPYAPMMVGEEEITPDMGIWDDVMSAFHPE